MILTRQFENQYGTFGELELNDDVILKTLELQYKSNQKNISCVPLGEYDLEPHASQKHGSTVALVNPALSVNHFKARNPEGRSAILFHSANTSDELEGCIAVGLELGVVAGKWGIIKSRTAMNILRASLALDKKLIIK